jgi:DNA gyrase subunit A
MEDLIADEDVVVAITHHAYIKRTPVSLYRSQGRGGKGIAAMGMREDDFVKKIYVASTHGSVLFFSDRGKVYLKRVYEIPAASRTSRGKAIVNVVGMEPGERVAAILPVDEFTEGRTIVTATRKGYVKKSDLMLYSSIRQTGIIGVVIEEGDSLIGAEITDGTHDLMLCTRQGCGIRFHEQQVRSMGRVSRGVIGISLRDGDEVVAMTSIPPAEEEDGRTLLTVCERGYGKRTELAEYRDQNRGGKGIIAIKTSERNGEVVGSLVVDEEDDVMIVTVGGQMIRIPARSVSVIGRVSQGVRLISMREEDERVASVERLPWEEDADEIDEPGAVLDDGDVADTALAVEEASGPSGETAGGEDEPAALEREAGGDTGGQEDEDGWERAIVEAEDEETD